jgi:hypothetical protein
MTITTDMTLYVAGPMSGYPGNNFLAFDAAAEDLRKRGFAVVSPAELDDEETRAKALASIDGAEDLTSGETHGDYLSRDVKLIADLVDGVCVLPGWQNSKGARLETFIAFLYGKPVTHYPSLRAVKKSMLAKAWLGKLFE